MSGARDPFSQEEYQIRLEWGRRGAARAAERGGALIVVDVLSFSTSVAVALDRGAVIYPAARGEEAQRLAEAKGAELAVPRRDVPLKGRFSLSPQTYVNVPSGTAVVLPSPNGATCASLGSELPQLFVGAFVNAKAVGESAAGIDGPITVLACGERWADDDTLRFALEDYLGAGAILDHMPGDASPEAEAAREAFRALRGDLERVMFGCGSGRELCEIGYEDDVQLAAKLDACSVVPVMVGDELRARA